MGKTKLPPWRVLNVRSWSGHVPPYVPIAYIPTSGPHFTSSVITGRYDKELLVIHLAPDYIYTPRGLEPNKIISISSDGRISSITDAGEQFMAPADISTLPGIVLLPGFVNAHSHAFQRALRGHTHRPLTGQD